MRHCLRLSAYSETKSAVAEWMNLIGPDPSVGSLSNIEAEALEESAASLGHQGRKAEKALAALRAASDEERSLAVDQAAEAVWAFFIQRELCGLRDHSLIIKEMDIPSDVLNRLGASVAKKG